MKVRLKRSAPGVERRLRAADFKALSISDQSSQVIWKDDNNHSVTLDDLVSQKLIEALPDEFEIDDSPDE